MNGQFDLITLISLIVAAVAIVKLRSVLGHRTDDDDQRVERLKTGERPAGGAEGASGDVISMPKRDRDDSELVQQREPDPADAEQRVRDFVVIDGSVTEGLLEVVKLDPAFDPQAFLGGAGMAYEMIVSSFAEGNRKGLKDLLSRDVYEGFAAAISDRDSRGEKVDQQFVGIKRSDIVEAEVAKGVASITVRFVSELITTTYDRAGKIVSGDPQKISDVTDIWTFSRDISTPRARTNPNWRLVATQAPN